MAQDVTLKFRISWARDQHTIRKGLSLCRLREDLSVRLGEGFAFRTSVTGRVGLGWVGLGWVGLTVHAATVAAIQIPADLRLVLGHVLGFVRHPLAGEQARTRVEVERN